MSPRPWIPLVLAGLAVGLAACSGSLATTSPSPTGGPTPTASPTAPATPTTAATMAASATASDSPADAYPLMASFAGHFTGSWNNTTFGSTGWMTWDIAADPSNRTVVIMVNVGGRFLGGAGGPPETITLTQLGSGVIQGQSSSFGAVSGTITPAGAVAITLTSPPGGIVSRVEITGTFSGGSSISLNYTVDFVGGGAKAVGSVLLTRS